MRLRVYIIAAIAAAMLLVAPATALAWSNGYEGNGYGTHDWMLDQALTLSGESWVDRDTALLATDDPDYVFGDTSNHVFRPDGDGRAAPSFVLKYYSDAVDAYADGDMEAASEALGILSHYYSDLSVPFHVGEKDTSTDGIHFEYEQTVDDLTDDPSENTSWITEAARVPLTDVRQRAVDEALYTRSTYTTFVGAYRAGGWDSSTVQSLTKANMSRSVNDLADIIQAIPNGTGVPDAGTVVASTTRSNVGQNSFVNVTAAITDDSGNPIEGARVEFEWQLPQGTITDVEYTEEDGVAESWENVGDVPLGSSFDVVATTTSGADSASDSVTMYVTETIDYIQTRVPYYDPMQNTLVTATCVILNEYGEPIPGLDVKFTWEHKSTTIEHWTTTDEWGVARHARNIGNSTIGHIVKVTASTQAGGTTRSSYATFRPKASTGARTNYSRVFGDNRYETGAAISRRAFPHGSEYIIVATGRNWPDALGGAALAGAHDAPIILCDRSYLPSAIKDEVKRLGATRAFILGGTNSVTPKVETELRACGVKYFTRLDGATRYQCARAIAQSVISNRGPAYDGIAFVSSGMSFPDALAASPLSAFRTWPIYLAEPGGNPSTLAGQMDSDGVREVIILGGDAAVSSAYEQEFDSTFEKVTRLGGRNRYDSAAIIAQYGIDNTGLGWDGVNMASGASFPDALAGGALANQKRSVMLLTYNTSLSKETAAILKANKAEVGTVLYLGGTASVSNDVRKAITATLE